LNTYLNIQSAKRRIIVTKRLLPITLFPVIATKRIIHQTKFIVCLTKNLVHRYQSFGLLILKFWFVDTKLRSLQSKIGLSSPEFGFILSESKVPIGLNLVFQYRIGLVDTKILVYRYQNFSSLYQNFSSPIPNISNF